MLSLESLFSISVGYLDVIGREFSNQGMISFRRTSALSSFSALTDDILLDLSYINMIYLIGYFIPIASHTQ